MIKNIIIFGTRKASYIHFLKYQLLGYTNIFFVNSNFDNRYNLNNIFPSLSSLTKEFIEDDNVLLCLKEYINIFNKNLYSQKYQQDILDFSNELTFYLNVIGS